MARTEMQQNAPQKVPILAPGTLPRGLSQAQGLALATLLAGKTMTSAAQAAGVNRSTVFRWLRDDPDFAAFYNGARQEMADSVSQSLRLLSASAVVTLRRLLSRKGVSDRVKLAAAVATLKLSSAPVAGPTDRDDAAVAIMAGRKAKKFDAMRARIGIDPRDVIPPAADDLDDD